MKSNDSLLSHMITQDDYVNHKLAKLVTDERITNPKTIKVKANEVVYLHYFHSNVAKFNITMTTATETIVLDRNNTVHHCSNTILRAVSDIHFKSVEQANFFVQLLRIQY
ncbi:hypothetical protein [Aquimarina longa]|uniref:hypothetical protein n=1 Tax=Aquimarina longa TaxID=1080221 RepID=UPI0007860549|nr:hypothetical protein [Aquimarina longa]